MREITRYEDDADPRPEKAVLEAFWWEIVGFHRDCAASPRYLYKRLHLLLRQAEEVGFEPPKSQKPSCSR